MLKILIFFLTFQLIVGGASAQTKVYKLVSKKQKSDFNYRAIKFIDTTGIRRNIFYPIKGRFTIYTFLATYKGWSRNEEEKEIDMHDILILKTDNQNKILDAYQYTLEWAEMPVSYDLYKLTVKGQLLKNKFLLENLKLRRVNYNSKKGQQFKEQGVLLL